MPYSAPAFGLLTTGFVPKLSGDVLLDITTQARSLVDPSLDLSPTEPVGQMVGILAGSIGELWQDLAICYNGINPNAADGMLLYGIGAITGTYLEGATFSKVIVTATLGMNATINAGLIANVSGQPTNTWQLLGACNGTDFNVTGPLVSSAPGNYFSVWQSTVTGPSIAVANTLTVVPTLPAGLVSITNTVDAVPGTNQETDTNFRIRRQLELAASGNDTIDAIRSHLLEVPGVISVQVYQNVYETVDAFGRPPHSVEAVIWDGDPTQANNDAIAQVLWDNAPSGIQFFSDTGDQGTAMDSQGQPQIMAFSRVQPVTIYIACTTTPTGNEAAVKTSIYRAALNLVPGNTVYRLQLQCAPLPDGPFPVTGIEDVPTFALDVTSSPTAAANLTMSVRQQPVVSTVNITVNGV